MKSQTYNFRSLLLLSISLLTIIVIFGLIFSIFLKNNSVEQTICHDIGLSATFNEPYPNYVIQTFPSPNSTLSMADFIAKSGIRIRLDVHELYKVNEGENYDTRPFNSENMYKPSTSRLLINSRSVSNKDIKVYQLDEITEYNTSSNLLIYEGARQLELFWPKQLTPGDYEVQYIIRNDLGCDILSYSWDFVIVDE